MKIAPPEGIAEEDYEAIEAAVMETVRGRWFLAEFARRSRVDEMRQMLDAVARLEQVVVEQRTAPADPSIRLLVQRLKDVAQQLNDLVADMRLQGYDETLCARIEAQARSVGGVLRLNAPTSALPASGAAEPLRAAPPRARLNDLQSREPLAEQTTAPPLPSAARQSGAATRVAALARLDALPLAAKLALFG